MSRWNKGDLIRCVHSTWQDVKIDQIYVVRWFDHPFVFVEGVGGGLPAVYFQPVEPIPAPQKAEEICTCGNQPQYCEFCIKRVEGWQDSQAALNAAMAKALAYGLPKSSGIPATARAIMNIVPEKKTPPLTDKQKQQAESIGRAVANMSRPHDVYMNCGKDWGA